MKLQPRFLLFFFPLFQLFPLAAQPGLQAEYFDGKDFNRKVANRIDPNIDLEWMETPPVQGIDPHDCSIRWTGRLTSPESGTYTFSAKVDDGIRVWIGNMLIIDAWDLNDLGRFTGNARLEKGRQYELKVEYFNALIEGEIHLLWELPSEKSFGKASPEVIPSKYFTQTPSKPVQKAKPTPPAEKKKPVAAAKPKQPVKSTTAQPAKPRQAEPAVVHVDTLEKYLPKNVLFEQSKAVLLPESFSELDRLAGFLNRRAELKLKVEGHTDVIGDPNKNLVLSQERADAVARYLSGKGVNTKRIEAKGYGSSRPLVNDRSKEGNQVNRRVAFIIH